MPHTRNHQLGILVILPVLFLFVSTEQTAPPKRDPLPSWSDGPKKRAILEFVKAVTTKGSPDFVPVAERVATFDNDGTLWCEKPTIQAVFTFEGIKKRAAKHPEWKTTQPFKAALEGDSDYLHKAGTKEILKLILASHANITQTQFRKEAAQFFATAKHPKFHVPYKKMTYQPMLELLEYLRANGFKTYICSGGGIYFMRVVTEEIYDIPPENVIGSSIALKLQTAQGKVIFLRLERIVSVNDREEKPVNIQLHIGRVPIFAAGNVKSGGDIAMLQYCQSNSRRTMQLMVYHDDAKREYAYDEPNNESLNAARKHGWTVISMKNDWGKIFSFE